MKKLILALLVITISSAAFSQKNKPTKKDIERFFKSTTYFVLDDNIFGMYNSDLKNAVAANWKITPYEFISMKQFREKRGNPLASFVLKTKVDFKKDKDGTEYSFLSVLMGRTLGTMDMMPDLAEFPISYYNKDYDKYGYKLGAILLFLQNHMEWIKEHPDEKTKSIINHYRKSKLSTKNKTLYLIKEELAKDVNSLAKIKKYYSGKVKITDAEDIEAAIKAKNKEVIFLHKVGAPKGQKKSRCYKLIIGAADAKIYYFDFHKIKKKKIDSFLSKDFKKIEKR